MDGNTLKLTTNDRLSFHDILYSAYDLWKLDDDTIDMYWEKIPLDLKLEAAKWGVSDTVVRDNIYVYLKNNRIDVNI